MTKITDERLRESKRRATLMDDPFMREFFEDNIECTQLILRIIMNNKTLIVKTVKVQYTLRGADGMRYVRLDVYAEDADGRHYDIEVENSVSGAVPQRARLNSAMIDVSLLKPNDDYSLLKERESVVIFITDKDVLGDGEPIYIIDRVIEKSGRKFNDGSHIIYVNSSHQDVSTELGRLMHDFHCGKPDEMYYPEIADKAREVGRSEKMGVWEELKRDAIAEGYEEGLAEGKAQASENIAVNFIKAGLGALDEIAKACGLTLQRVQELARTAS